MDSERYILPLLKSFVQLLKGRLAFRSSLAAADCSSPLHLGKVLKVLIQIVRKDEGGGYLSIARGRPSGPHLLLPRRRLPGMITYFDCPREEKAKTAEINFNVEDKDREQEGIQEDGEFHAKITVVKSRRPK